MAKRSERWWSGRGFRGLYFTCTSPTSLRGTILFIYLLSSISFPCTPVHPLVRPIPAVLQKSGHTKPDVISAYICHIYQLSWTQNLIQRLFAPSFPFHGAYALLDRDLDLLMNFPPFDDDDLLAPIEVTTFSNEIAMYLGSDPVPVPLHGAANFLARKQSSISSPSSDGPRLRFCSWYVYHRNRLSALIHSSSDVCRIVE